jgi:hypothetical protein
MFVFIWVSEIDFNEGASTSGVVENGSDNTLDIALSFDKIKISVSGRCDSFRFGSGVNATHFTLSLA